MLFILPPGKATLLQRLRGRARESEPVIQKRYAQAQREIEMAKASDVYDHFLVNNDLDKTIERVIEIIEHHRGAS